MLPQILRFWKGYRDKRFGRKSKDGKGKRTVKKEMGEEKTFRSSASMIASAFLWATVYNPIYTTG